MQAGWKMVHEKIRKKRREKIKKVIALIICTIFIGFHVWMFLGMLLEPRYVMAEETGDTWLDKEVVETIEKIAPAYNISTEIILALVETESSGDANALSTSGKHIGLCQINYLSHKDVMDTLDISSADDLYDPVKNLNACCMILDRYREKYGDILEALCRYEGRTRAYPNNYVRKIINRAYDIEEARGLHDYE